MNRAVLAAVLCLAFVAVLIAVPVPAAYAQTCDPKDPKCPPKKNTADCSPGYYKNHPEAWCDVTCPTTNTVQFTGTACTLLLEALGAKGPGSEFIRGFAKDTIDACFGTAEASPCTDD